MNSAKRTGQNNMQVIVRPEIRKGCIWGLQFKFTDVVVGKMSEFSTTPQDFNSKTPYLSLVVKSKLLQTELPFSKVAQLLNEGANIQINKSNTALLNVKFTSRPRTVFHRHSDVMILLAVIKKGDQIICSDEVELIFRGGTGSVHSADSKKSTSPPPNPNYVKMEGYSGRDLGQDNKSHDHFAYPSNNNNNNTRPDFDGPPELWPIDMSGNQNKIMPQMMTIATPQSFEELMRSEVWNEPFPHYHPQFAHQMHPHSQGFPGQFQTLHQHPHPHHQQQLHLQHMGQLLPLQPRPTPNTELQPFLLQPMQQQLQRHHAEQQQQQHLHHQQQLLQNSREKQLDSSSLSSHLLPSLDIPQSQHQQQQQPSSIGDRKMKEVIDKQEKEEKKRKIEVEDFPIETSGPKEKKSRVEDNDYSEFKHLFLACLPFMNLKQIANICAGSQVPIYAVNTNSEIIYANQAFYSLIALLIGDDITFNNIDEIQLAFDSLVQSRAGEHDRFILTQEERSAHSTEDLINQYDCICNFTRQWSTLPDGQSVILSLISYTRIKNKNDILDG